MKLRKIANNVTVIETTNNGEDLAVLISYETPVACRRDGYIYEKTSKKWSATTSRHINSWVEDAKVTERPQEYFDNLLNIEN